MHWWRVESSRLSGSYWVEIGDVCWGPAYVGCVPVQDIDDILRNRTEKRQLGNSKGNTFSTATFSVEEEPQVPLPLPTTYPRPSDSSASQHVAVFFGLWPSSPWFGCSD